MASVVTSAQATSVSGSSTATATAQVVISAANVPDKTLVYVEPARSEVVVSAFVEPIVLGRATATVVVSAQGSTSSRSGAATAAVVINATARGLKPSLATASVVVSASAEGAAQDLGAATGRADVTIQVSANPVSIASANAIVSASARAAQALSIVTATARADVTCGATAVESAGVRNFPRAAPVISINASARGARVASPVKNIPTVTGKSIDWKTLCDAYNSREAPVPEYTFGYGTQRRNFRQTG